MARAATNARVSTLNGLGVLVFGGLPIGHGPNPIATPLGTMATLDCDAETLTVEPAVR